MRRTTSRRNRGFTLVELMMTLAIVSILMVMALPLYKGYAVRAEVAEGLGLVGSFKSAIGYYYLVNGNWPTTNKQAALAAPTSYSGNYVDRIGIQPIMSGATYTGQIEVEIRYNSDAIPALGTDNTIVIRPDADSGGSFKWDCRYGSVPERYRPKPCR